MVGQNRIVIIMLLILALFTGATIELSEGSTYVGVLLFGIAVFLITRIRLTESKIMKSSRFYFLFGLLIVLADIIYNFINSSNLGTLDSMAFFLGVSLIALSIKNPQVNLIGEFGVYISAVFIIMFLIFYSIFGALNIDFLHVFDHYFVLLPTVTFMNFVGIPLEVVAIETVKLNGVEDMLIVIGGPCSGLYSMFLLMGIVVGYSRIEKMNMQKTLSLLGFSVAVAYLSNLMRVTILYIAAYFYGQETMMMVHTHLGWIIFAIVAGGIMYVMNYRK